MATTDELPPLTRLTPVPADSSWQLLPLELLAPGQAAMIDQVHGEPEQVHRLSELGLRPGVAVDMLQSGSPCIVRVGDSKLCFRESELLSVLVRVGDAS